jgi:DUF4097 and DUF4098 domain-containing protein YvlB
MMKHLLVMILALSAAACDAENGSSKVNGSIKVEAGQAPDNASTVNGAIHVASNAAVKHAETVNGSITIDDQATAESAETVNGSITLGPGAKVSGNVSSVNGALTLQKGADVAGKVSNVNGRFNLDAAHVGGGLHTVTGDITVGADSKVEGGITVEQVHGFNISFTKDVPVIIIGPGATVQGPMKFEREVKLYVSDRATIGEVTGATPIKFSGDQPPT